MEEKDRLAIARKYIEDGDLDSALLYLANCIVIAAITPGMDKSEIFYLFGNIYRKKGDFRLAMDYYTKAINENPDTPAVEARKVLQGIMDFYNKDMFNH